LAAMLATLLLAAQAPAWQGGNTENGAVTTVQQSSNQAQNPDQLRSQIASDRADMNRELARENPNMDTVRALNRRIARDRHQLNRMMQQRQPQQRQYQRRQQQRGGGWGMQRGRGRGGHMGGGHMMGGHGYR
jgi:hypothetical protein